MRTHPARWGASSTLAFVPALVSLWAANWLEIQLYTASLLQLRFTYGVCDLRNLIADTWLLGAAAAAYSLWILAVARRWITMATGGGFVVAAHGLILRVVVEFPQTVAQIPLSVQPPPQPYATVLPLGRAFGLVAYVAGFGFVLASVLAERRLRRLGPDWAITP